MLWWHSIATTLRLAVGHEEYTHLLLIVPVSAALILLDRQYLVELQRPNAFVGIMLWVVAIGLLFLARSLPASLPDDQRLGINMLALVGASWGSFFACFGARAFRVFLFPLLFLLWFVPWPAALVDQVVFLLQHASAWLSGLMFAAAGVPVTRDGLLLSIPGLNLEVAKECSSIRSSLMLMVCSMVLAHLFLQSWWRRLVVWIAAAVLSFGKNALRIFTISMLGTKVDPTFLTGKLHHRGGVVFFLIAQAAVILLLWILQRTEHRSAKTTVALYRERVPSVPRP